MSRNPLARRRIRAPRLLVALLTLVLVGGGVLAAVPAQAERFIHHDKSRDVQKVRIFDQNGDDFVRAPGTRQGDFVKVKMWHQVRAVRVVGKFRQLQRKGLGLSQVVFIRTPDDLQFFQVTAGPGMWKGVEMATTDEMDEDGGFADDSPCMTHRVNYKRDRFSMRISRACLGRPAWVRVAVAFVNMERRSVSFDDAIGTNLEKRLPFSPRLVHGDPR